MHATTKMRVNISKIGQKKIVIINQRKFYFHELTAEKPKERSYK